MSLYDKLKEIPKEYWKYYSGIICSGYDDAIQEPLNFIKSNFCCGGKNEFLCKSLFDFEQVDNEEQNKRAIHTVNAFLFGLYLIEKIDFLKPHNNSFLAKDKNFIWAWFLCSLYHDAFFDKNEDVSVECKYHYFSDKLLYNPNLIKRYYDKCKTKETAYNWEIKFDHGIVAAEKLYSNYINMIVKKVQNEPNSFKDFIANKDLDYYNLKINYSTFCAMCKIAKIIASHNIFIANDKTKDTYKNVPELIPGNKNFYCMPNVKNRLMLNSYEKLYFLLALVDTLEPSKRGMDLKDIEIRVDKIQYSVYDLHLTFLSNKGNQDEYLNGTSELKDWLNFVDVSEDKKIIHIDFNNNRNHG